MEAHVSEQKKKLVKEFTDLLKEYPIVGAVNMENLPAKQLQNMRAQLRGKVVLRMAKRRLLKIALDNVKADKPGIEGLKEKLMGMPALLFTKENPFTLYKNLQKNKSTAPAKAGQTAIKDIIVKAGPTPFAPGPVIGELGAIGIKAGIDGGKVAIKEDAVVVKEGEEVKAPVAAILTRLGIEPMEIGLDLVAAYEDGSIFGRDILGVDEQEYIDNIAKCASWSFNLAMETGVMTKETTECMVTKAFNNAKALALEQDILTKETVDNILAKAHGQMMAVKSNVP